MRACLPLTLVLSIALALPASAQEAGPLDGAWTLTFSTSYGTVNLPVELRQEGTTLRGTSGTALGYETDFEAGEVDGSSFSFDVFVEVEGEWYPIGFSGRLENGELTGRADIPDGTRATFRGVRATPS